MLTETDKNLNQETNLVLIGGTALVIKYLSPRSTIDVDTYSKISKQLKLAWQKAEKKIGLAVPLSQSPISDGPYRMKDRFTLYNDLKLKYLKVFLPEAPDIVLMKTLRLLGKDRDDIRHLIKHCRIRDSILLKRFTEEMDHVVGNYSVIKSHYLFIIEDSFGKMLANKHQKVIEKIARQI